MAVFRVFCVVGLALVIIVAYALTRPAECVVSDSGIHFDYWPPHE